MVHLNSIPWLLSPKCFTPTAFPYASAETLGIGFNCFNPRRDVEKQLLRPRIMTQVTLLNLCYFTFGGTNAYLDVLLPWLTIPLLDRLTVNFFSRMVYSIPLLRQLISTAGNIRPKTAVAIFHEDHLGVAAYPHDAAELYTLDIELDARHLDW